jgi:hypothetical protein
MIIEFENNNINQKIDGVFEFLRQRAFSQNFDR